MEKQIVRDPFFLQQKSEPATETDMVKYLDIEPGSVSVMGLMNDEEHVAHE